MKIARLLLRLYPRAWRERYEEEFGALIEMRGVDARVIADVLVAAVRERLHQMVGQLSWVPKLIGLYSLASAVLLATNYMRPRLGFDFWDLNQHARLFEGFAFLCLSFYVGGRIWSIWRPRASGRSAADRIAAQFFILLFGVIACYLSGVVAILLGQSILPIFIPFAYQVVPDSLTFRPTPRLVGHISDGVNRAPSSFLGLGPGASA